MDRTLSLGIETTCDETAVAVVENGKTILSNVIASQEELHSLYGGVIPELASRRHAEVISQITEKSLEKAGVLIEELDLISVAYCPGLIGSLLVGLNFAKGLSLSLNVPLIGVNHVEAHLYAATMGPAPEYPALGVVLSGGHTALFLIDETFQFQLIGKTQDDAIGEAFDKVAKLLELPYPGGPNIEKLAQNGNPDRYLFNCGHVKKRLLDFSFSGLKTSVLYLVKGQNAQKNAPLVIAQEDKKDVAASFQHAAFTDVIKKIGFASEKYFCKSILVGGGVSQNLYLRSLLEQKAQLPIFWPTKDLCLDNAAMIAGLGFQIYTKNPFTVNLEPKTRVLFKEISYVDQSLSTLPTSTPFSLHQL